jgi:pimeloyl-ACP methyl ester carboxylesterase
VSNCSRKKKNQNRARINPIPAQVQEEDTMAATSGILYVTMQPKPGLSEVQFHDWYNNEHGPTRLRLKFCTNGFRYRANDLEGAEPSESKPEWMAIYDVTDMAELTQETYLRLRGPPVKTQREADTMAQINIDRKLYDFLESRESKEFMRLENVENEGQGNVIVAVFVDVNEGMTDQLDKWYTEEHIDMLSKVPGWLRTRRFVTSSIDSNAPKEYLALHEYAPNNGLGGPEFQAVTATPWTQEIMTKVVKDKRRRVYDLYYTFGAASRYLSPKLSDWTTTDPTVPFPTRTFSTTSTGTDSGAIDSYITTPDGVPIPYRLEGSLDLSAPLIVLDNSILTTSKIWDSFLKSFFSHPQNRQYRILRFEKRGRFPDCGTQPITIDVLASDIISLLDALRVQRAAAVIGVSLGGCTTLNFALKYPNRLSNFISCDTSAASPAGNAKAWGERITLSSNEGAVSASNISIVGQTLAEATTRRWFQPASYSNPSLSPILEEVKQMVATNSFEGFKKSVNALFEYDLEEEMKGAGVRGMFVVGGEDGWLPKTMKEMSENYGNDGARYEVIEGAGHLPMVERPNEFADVVSSFLEG